jgi:hypothetical protein
MPEQSGLAGGRAKTTFPPVADRRGYSAIHGAGGAEEGGGGSGAQPPIFSSRGLPQANGLIFYYILTM